MKLGDASSSCSKSVTRMADWGETERGFALAELPFSDYKDLGTRTLQVQQSSLATEDKLWVGPNTTEVLFPDDSLHIMERMHLGVEEVRWLHARLGEWLEGKE